MKKIKHTPGPWTITKTNDVVVGFDFVMSPGKSSQEIRANAKLIAAAPDLLEACQYVVDWHRENDSGEGELFGLDFVTTCISAIRKATE
jgi:hypothetical protein